LLFPSALRAVFKTPAYALSPITLSNGWTAGYGDLGDPVAYKDASGRVFLAGAVSGGTTSWGTVLLTLPVGYRPAETPTGSASVYPVSVNTTGFVWETGHVLISANGGMASLHLPGNNGVSLNGISFYAG